VFFQKRFRICPFNNISFHEHLTHSVSEAKHPELTSGRNLNHPTAEVRGDEK
jgi:hypothetical protein